MAEDQPNQESPLPERFILAETLGKGASGIVRRAFDRKRGEWVALKTLRTVHGDAIYRLKSEFRAASDLDHPNLVPLYELFQADGQCFFTMKLVEGEPITRFVRSAATSSATFPCDLERVRVALAQVVAAVDALHRFGWVHRDLKPAHILVDQQGHVTVIDLGCMQAIESDGLVGSSEDDAPGTLPYAGPEQIAGARALPASDWYSVGAVLYEALTGQPPLPQVFPGSAREGVAPSASTSERDRSGDPGRSLSALLGPPRSRARTKTERVGALRSPGPFRQA